MAARRVDGLLVERAGDELLVVREATQEAHALNEAAAVVFDLADGSTSRSEMAAEVARRTNLPADEAIVDLALAELVDAGLITVDDLSGGDLTRRSVIRRLALPAAAVALLPIVETILVPSPAAGQSGPMGTPTPTPMPPQ